MSLYEIIYNFYRNYIFTGDTDFLSWNFPMDYYDTMNAEYLTYGVGGQYWLCDTFTIITMSLIVIVLIRLIIWLFKLFGNILGGGK